jgi:phage recombination protein Bet
MGQLTPNQKIANMTGYKEEEIGVIKSTVAKGTTDTELAYFLSVAKSTGLSPFLKEVWAYKDGKGNLIVLAGRDGFLKKAQESPNWNGMSSSEVCENDKFELDIPSAVIKHSPNFKDRGKIMGAYAIVKPKGCDLPTVEWADFKTYDKGQYIWKQFPSAMIKKVAEANALKKAFGINGLQSEYDFHEQNNIVVPIAEVKEDKDNMIAVKRKIVDGLAVYQGDDKDMIMEMCKEKSKSNEFTYEFAQSVAQSLGVEL